MAYTAHTVACMVWHKYFFVTTLDQLFGTSLYGLAPAAGDNGWMGYLLPPGAAWGENTISLTDAWVNSKFRATQGGVFVFAPIAPDLGNAAAVNAIIQLINTNTGSRQTGFCCWISGGNSSAPLQWITGFNFAFGSAFYTPVQNVPLSFQVSLSVTMSIQTNCSISLANDLFTITPANGGLCQIITNFGGNTRTNTLNSIFLPGYGPELGCLKTDVAFTSATANFPVQQLALSYFISSSATENTYPMLVTPPTDQLHITIDPACLLTTQTRQRTYFLFASKQAYTSAWFTDSGQALLCLPNLLTQSYPNTNNLIYPLPGCGLIVMQNEHLHQDYDFTPSGNFFIAPKFGVNNPPFNLLCGLSGVETIRIQPPVDQYQGDMICFEPGHPATANNFPAQPGVVATDLLTDAWRTSWVTIRAYEGRQESIPYFSQPNGASLYAANSGIGNSDNQLLGFYEPIAADLAKAQMPCFVPMVPYGQLNISNAQQQANIASFESTILSVVRKQQLSAIAQAQLATARKKRIAADTGSNTLSTSPQGLLVSVNSDWGWDSLILAQNQLPTGSYSLNFAHLDPLLQSAFQTNQQFLVISQNMPLTGGAGNILGQFSNEMSLEGWPFLLNVPTADTNGNYNNILIFKFCKGALIDRVTQTDSWTAAADFNITDNEGLSSLSGWLKQYITQGVENFTKNNDPNFQQFAAMATDPNWQGILALKTDISLQDFPPDLQGLIGGIDLSLFYGHHFGINVNFVQQDGGALVMNPVSSMFGLIDYTDPLFLYYNQNLDTYKQNAPNPGGDYNFVVLTLKVLFANSRIQNFQSYVQLTINKLFGDAVTPVSNNNIIIFTGSYENHNGSPTYVFNETGDNLLALDSNVWNGVEIIKANFSTISGGTKPDSLIQSRFLFWGYLNFQQLQGLDLLSFGSNAGAFSPGDGLGYSNMAIDMNFNLNTPSAKTFIFDVSHLSFDATQSSTQPFRPPSLYGHFPLQITGITLGSADSQPVSQGYVNVIVPDLANTYGAPQSDWYGLVFNLNMGTLGALASAAGLNTTFLAYWGTKSSGVGVGIRLPGVTPQAKMLSLQGVLNLSVGSIKLQSALTQGETPQPTYLLMLNSIAIKFLGLTFPPGNTNFYLFGDPDTDAQPGSLGWYIAYQKKA
jgi:hypothetical protein